MNRCAAARESIAEGGIRRVRWGWKGVGCHGEVRALRSETVREL
jgi:hypothetical protein